MPRHFVVIAIVWHVSISPKKKKKKKINYVLWHFFEFEN